VIVALLDFTNAFEILSAPLKLLLDLNSFLVLLELNADVETPSWNAQPVPQSLLAFILKITLHTPLEPPLEPLELPEPLELLELLLLPQSPLFNLLTKTLYAEISDGIVSTSLKEILLTLALITLAVMSEMVVNAIGILIPMLVHVLVILSVLTLEVVTLPPIAETQTTLSALLTHVVVLVVSVFPSALNKLPNKFVSLC